MLAKISVAEVRHIAELGNAVRTERDRALKIKGEDIEEPPPARGEHNSTAALGWAPLPDDNPVLSALRDAIGALSGEARHELRALLAIGRGEHAPGQWEDALAAAAQENKDLSIGTLMEEVDLHHFLMKGLYELKLA